MSKLVENVSTTDLKMMTHKLGFNEPKKSSMIKIIVDNIDVLPLVHLKIILKKNQLPSNGSRKILLARIMENVGVVDRLKIKANQGVHKTTDVVDELKMKTSKNVDKVSKIVGKNKKTLAGFAALAALGFGVYQNREDLKNLKPEDLNKIIDKIIGENNRKKIQTHLKLILGISEREAAAIGILLIELKNKVQDFGSSLKNIIVGLYSGSKIKVVAAINKLMGAIGFSVSERISIGYEYYKNVLTMDNGLAKLMAIKQFVLVLMAKIAEKVLVGKEKVIGVIKSLAEKVNTHGAMGLQLLKTASPNVSASVEKMVEKTGLQRLASGLP